MKKSFLFTAVAMLFIGFGSIEVNASNCPDPVSSEVCASRKSSSTSVDKFLRQYESYVNQYVRLAKKAKNGDLTAASELASLAAKAANLVDKIDRLEGDMTSAQLAKYARITAKMTKAAY